MRRAIHSYLHTLLRLDAQLLPLHGPESLLDGLDHLPEPVEVQRVQHDVAAQVRARQPDGDDAIALEAQDLGMGFEVRSGGGGVCCENGEDAGGMDGGPDVLINADGLVGAPDEAAGEKGREQDEPVVELDAGAGQVELVAKPVDVEEGGGELVEDEGGSVEVDKGTLLESEVSAEI